MHLNKFLFLTMVFVLLFSDLIYSQNEYSTFRGVIKDQATGEGIPFATIVILEKKLGVNSNVNGLFMMKGIPKKKFKVQISAVGYVKEIFELDFKEIEDKVYLYKLKPSPVEMNAVITEENRSRSENVSNISIHNITAEELKAIPLPVEKDIIRSLRTIPGISTTSDVSGQFFVRGGAGDQNLILYDDFLIYNPFHALGLFSIFDGNNIKNYEIQTGGFDPEYGGRLSSVLNVTSKEGNRNYYNGDFRLGMLSMHAGVNGPIPYGTVNLSVRKSLFDDIYKKFIKQDMPLSFYDVSAKTTFDFTESGKISFHYFTTGDKLDRKYIEDPAYKWISNAYSLNFQSFITQFIFSSSYSYSEYEINKDFESIEYGQKAFSKLSTGRLNMKAEYLFESNDIISAGISVHSSSIRHDITNGYGFQMEYFKDNNDIALWTKYKFIGLPNTIIDAGIRFSHSSSAGDDRNLLEPRANIKYKISDHFSIKGSFSRMHQSIISIQDENDVIALFQSYIPITDVYQPERADQYVLGFETQITDNYILILQGYLKDIFNYLDYNQNRKTVLDPDFSSGQGKSKGLEFYLKFNYEFLYGWLTYNLSWTDKTVDNYKFYPRFDKRHSLSAVLSIKLPYNINMGVIWDFATGMPFTPIANIFLQPIISPDYYAQYPIIGSSKHTVLGAKNSFRLPKYHKMDINFSRSFSFEYLPKVDLSLDITNIYDQKNIFYYDAKTGNRVNQLSFFISGSIGIEI